MSKRMIVVLILIATAFSQTSGSKYQPGTITAVALHRGAPGEQGSAVAQYDVSVKVGNTTYVVLFTPPNGASTVKYAVGDGLLVLVGSKTLTFNNPGMGRTEVPILSHTTSPAQNLDWSKAPGQYFSMKLQHLSEKLTLTDDQQADIKPILEQEAAEVGEICVNPALSNSDKQKQYDKIVRVSDGKIKPLLSASQLQKLQELRKDQKQDVKRIIAEQKSTN